MRIDPEPEGPELNLLVAYLDFQRETVLAKTEGLTEAQMVQRHPPSALTLAGLLYHLALVEESWLEVRFSGLPERESVGRRRLGGGPRLGVPHGGRRGSRAAAGALQGGLCAESKRCLGGVRP